MTSGHKPQAKDVLFILSAKHHRPDFQYPERRIVLEARSSSNIKIGRTSKRVTELEAKAGNCYFDSPVMSREHAEFTVDWWLKKIYIKDVGSLHGTFLNSQRLSHCQVREVVQGDVIKFGIDIQRSNELFPPCTIEVHYEFDHLVRLAREASNPRPTFSVPDDSDSSDNEDDEDGPGKDIRTTVEMIRKIDMQRSDHARGKAVLDPIDLTGDADLNGSSAKRQPAVTAIVEDDNTKDVTGLLNEIHSSAQPELAVTVDEDALHDEDDQGILQPISAEVSESLFESGSESDESFVEDESLDLDDDMPSEVDHSEIDSSEPENEGHDETEALKDSHYERELDFESEREGSEDEIIVEKDMTNGDIGSPAPFMAEFPSFDNASLGQHESQLEGTPWKKLPKTQQQDHADIMPERHIHAPACCVPLQTSFHAPIHFQPRLMESHTLPSLEWPALPLTEQPDQAQAHPKDFRLPPLQNPTSSQLGNPAQRFASARSTYLTSQRETDAPRHPPWHQTYFAPNQAIPLLKDNVWALPRNDGPSAEALGQMTGKPEFFAAREHNKVLMKGQEDFQGPLPALGQPVTAEVPANHDMAQSQTTNVTDHPTTVESVKEASEPADMAESVWMTAGKKFLDSPEVVHLSNDRESSPDLDMTSAFQFHQSKLAASSSQTSIAPKQATEIAEQVHEPASPRSTKRKANEISTILPREEADEEASAGQQNGASVQDTHDEASSASDRSCSVIPAGHVVERTEQPPAKRSRVLPSWGSISTFGLGGVMFSSVVVGVLAATAPTL